MSSTNDLIQINFDDAIDDFDEDIVNLALTMFIELTYTELKTKMPITKKFLHMFINLNQAVAILEQLIFLIYVMICNIVVLKEKLMRKN